MRGGVAQTSVVKLDVNLPFYESPPDALDVLAQDQEDVILGLVEMLSKIADKLDLLQGVSGAEVERVVLKLLHGGVKQFDLLVLMVASGATTAAAHGCHFPPCAQPADTGLGGATETTVEVCGANAPRRGNPQYEKWENGMWYFVTRYFGLLVFDWICPQWRLLCNRL